MIEFTVKCPDNADHGVDANGCPYFTAICDDSLNNGLVNGLPTVYFDCTDDPVNPGTPVGEKTITVVADGQTYIYDIVDDEVWNHLVNCQTCGPGVDLPAVITIDCGPGIDLPPVVTI